MQLRPHHMERIARTIAALEAMAETSRDARVAEVLIEAAFYLTVY